MIRSSQLAVIGLGILAGAGIGFYATGTLHGQPTVPVPAPVVPADAPVRLAPVAAAPAKPDPFSYREVVKKVIPAVVSIEAKAVVPPQKVGALVPQGVPDEFRRFFELAAPELAERADPNLGFGSGVIVDASGVIITNFHVVQGADIAEVKLADGRIFTTKDIRKDPKTDLAVLRIQAKEALPALELGDSESMEVGDRVLAIGAPFGLTGSVTHGIVSAKSRDNLKLNQYEDFLQTDAAINPGNSGGPLVNLEGKVIGINSAIKTKSGGFQGVGLAISSNMVRDIANQLLKTGVVQRGYLGISIRELDDELATRLGVKKGNGVVITKVLDDGPCGKAGLQLGDVITSVGGTAITDANSLPKIVSRLPVNEKAEIIFARDGKLFTLPVNLDPQPDEYGAKGAPANNAGPNKVNVAEIGLTTIDMTPEVAAQLGFPRETRGAVVVGVERGSLASLAGLNRGAVIVRVDKTNIANAKQLSEAIGAAMKEKGALLYVLRPNGDVEFAVLKLK